MKSFLATGGSSIYKSSGALKRKIACQTTSLRATLFNGKETWHKI